MKPSGVRLIAQVAFEITVILIAVAMLVFLLSNLQLPLSTPRAVTPW